VLRPLHGETLHLQQKRCVRHLVGVYGAAHGVEGHGRGFVPQHRLLHFVKVLHDEILPAPLLACSRRQLRARPQPAYLFWGGDASLR
ncbi:unnamed protein product, partial [Laminaria digitata]